MTKERSVRYANIKAYRTAEEVHDAQLVGRAEILRLAGRNPDVARDAMWWSQIVQRKGLPPADGQRIDDKPTWKRATILLWLHGAVPQPGGRGYRSRLAPEFHAEAEALIDELGLRDLSVAS